MAKWEKRNAKAMDSKSKGHEVVEVARDTYEVTSGTSGQTYTVSLRENGGRCTCDWAKYHRRGEAVTCSHVIAVHKWLAAQEGRRATAWASYAEATRQHKPLENIGEGIILTKALRS